MQIQKGTINVVSCKVRLMGTSEGDKPRQKQPYLV